RAGARWPAGGPRRRSGRKAGSLRTPMLRPPVRRRERGSRCRWPARAWGWTMLANAVSVSPSRSTPMLRQYFEIKSPLPDAILLCRMGVCYEMFCDDAREAAPVLGIALTARHKDSDIEAPMCGVPHHSVEHHIARLVAAGRKVAVCDQVEDPRAAKGLVRRAITRIVTPGTVLDPESLSPGAPSYLCALVPAE